MYYAIIIVICCTKPELSVMYYVICCAKPDRSVMYSLTILILLHVLIMNERIKTDLFEPIEDNLNINLKSEMGHVYSFFVDLKICTYNTSRMCLMMYLSLMKITELYTDI